LNQTAARLFVLPLALLALIATSNAVLAHGPSRKKAAVEQVIDAPPEAVWAVIGNFQDMSWHPAVTKTTGTGGSAPGATRTLTLQGGGEIMEKLEKYDAAGHSLFYRIEQVDPKVLPVTNYSSTLSVAPAPDGSSLVTWKGAFYRGYPNNDPPTELNDEAAVAAVTGVYQAGLTHLKAVLEKAGN
jgi:hypothetical protein